MDYRLQELSPDSIRIFENYLPLELVEQFEKENYFGWGVLAEGEAVGAGVFAWSDGRR